MYGVLLCGVLRWDYRWEGCYGWSAGVWSAKGRTQAEKQLCIAPFPLYIRMHLQ